MLAYECPVHSIENELAENENLVNLKSASFVVIRLLHKGFTHIHSQKKPKLQEEKSFFMALSAEGELRRPTAWGEKPLCTLVVW